MRGTLTYIMTLWVGLGVSYTQPNLILNPSVEDTDSCPDWGVGNFYYIQHWSNSNNASPDYFNTCHSNNQTGIPKNQFGYQYPHSGNAYLGLAFANFANSQGREGIQGKFSETLQKDRKYCFEFYTVRANITGYAVGEFGIYLSKDSVHKNVSNNLGVSPYYSVDINFLGDTVNWTKFSVEINNYEDDIQYFVFSNFQNAGEFQLVIVDSGVADTTPVYTYYYFDDFALYDCGEADTLPPDPPGPTDSLVINFPTVFTPNGDGINDVLHLEGLPPGSNLEVYNRWRDFVFKAHPYTAPWDGNKNGHPCPEGVYHYMVQLPDGQTVQKFVHLFR